MRRCRFHCSLIPNGAPALAVERHRVNVPERVESECGLEPPYAGHLSVVLVNHDAAAIQLGSGAASVTLASLVVIEHILCRLVPDLDAELVLSPAAIDLPVDCSENESVSAGSVEPALSLELSTWSGNNQPFVTRAVE